MTRNQLHAHSSQPWGRPRSAAYKSRAGNSGHLDLVRNKKRAGRDKARATAPVYRGVEALQSC